MHFNLNFAWFIFNLGHFKISPSTRFPRVPYVLIQFCKPCLHCKPPRSGSWRRARFPVRGATGVLPARFFCQHGWHCRLSVTSVRFLSYLSSNINTTSATDFSVTDISSWATSSWFPSVCQWSRRSPSTSSQPPQSCDRSFTFCCKFK